MASHMSPLTLATRFSCTAERLENPGTPATLPNSYHALVEHGYDPSILRRDRLVGQGRIRQSSSRIRSLGFRTPEAALHANSNDGGACSVVVARIPELLISTDTVFASPTGPSRDVSDLALQGDGQLVGNRLTIKSASEEGKIPTPTEW